MGIKDQLNKLKENWLILLLVLVVVIGPMFFGSFGSYRSISTESFGLTSLEYAEAPRAAAKYDSDDAGSGAVERIITKDASLSTEVERGTFHFWQDELKKIIAASDSILLNENVNKYDSGWKEYYRGYYQIKVPTVKYDEVIAELKTLGEVESFRETATDVTESYLDLNTELEVEKERLKRYQAMYDEAVEVADKIELNDRIFNQERRIKYLEERIENIDQRVDYSQVYFTLDEKRSEYAYVALVKFSELVRGIVDSLNALLKLFFWAAPWLMVYIIYRIIKKKVSPRKRR
ncbi:DUF4349 domain-containing protein [Candidatus Woesearchaeota archaeon]|nr:DUF4349 domain-containing protein [Candidatus Woesearchaeota archaeon]